MSNRAWVTLATNDSYGLGALVLAHSLRRVGSEHPAVVLITPSVTDAMRERLNAVFSEVVTVDVLDSGDAAHLALLQRPELGVTFTKIHCWNLTQYEKCVFLDADTLVVQNSDELFEREELSAAPDVGWPDCFNSGVFVFKPSAETFGKLIAFAQERGSFDGGDQGLLNSFFSDWARSDISKHLPFLYNVTSAAFYSYLPALKQFGQDLKIIHFIGAAKPWLQHFNFESRTVDAPDHIRGLLQLWWDIFAGQVHSQLDAAMSGVAGNLARVVAGGPHEAIDDLTRRQGWEAGNIDYMGADSFDKIWAKISQTLTQPRSSPSPPKESPPQETPVQVEVAKEAVSAPVEVAKEAEPVAAAPVDAPAPVSEPVPVLEPESAQVPEPTPAPVPEPTPVSEPAPVVASVPVSESVPAPVPEPTPVAEPIPVKPKPEEPAAPAVAPAPEAVVPAVEAVAEVPVTEAVPETPAAEAVSETPATEAAEATPVSEAAVEKPTPEAVETLVTPIEPAAIDDIPVTVAETEPKTESAPTATESAEASATPEKIALHPCPVATDDIPVATDSPPLANTPSKEEAPAVPAAKSEERRKVGKLQLSPPAAADPLPTPDSEAEDAAALAHAIIASELSTAPAPPTVTSPLTPAEPLAPFTPTTGLTVEEPQVPTPPVGAVSLAQIGVKPKEKTSTAAQLESSIAAATDKPEAQKDAPKKKIIKKVVKKDKDAAGAAAGADAPVPPPRKKEKKPKEK